MRAMRFLLGLVVIVAVAAGIFILAAWQPALAPINPSQKVAFAPASVQRGAELAAVGDCDVCHTAPGGRAFAGGLPIPTPFGTIYSTNITPDPKSGIGNWSEAAFQRAMRTGVRRDGQYLYPAFPYRHFTLITDDDDRALYAFLMTRPAVRTNTPPDALPFPFNVRLIMFGWNFLFLHQGPYRGDTAQSAIWNRGAYLADGLGHCGACHTPRNFLGAEKRGQRFGGGEAEGWTAYALNDSAPAALPWTADDLAAFLRSGFDPSHGAARGPMLQVVENLHVVSADDVRAIAAYIASQRGNAGSTSQESEKASDAQSRRGQSIAPQTADSQTDVVSAVQQNSNGEGARIYSSACAGCHEGPRAMPYGGIDLALSSSITGPRARNLMNVVLHGLPAGESGNSPIMPGFAASMDDSQLVALAAYLRARFSGKPPWTDIEASVGAARNPQFPESITPAVTNERAPPIAVETTGNEAQR